MTKQIFDVAIVGAGIAGCHLAQLLVKRGHKVALIDRKPLISSGPHWINAVPAWMFDEADLPHPEGAELFDVNDRFIIRAPDKKTRLAINELGVFDVNMALLGQRLKSIFLSHGAKAHAIEADVVQGNYDNSGRLVTIDMLAKRQPLQIKASLFVDASGLRAVLRRNHPLAPRIWPEITINDCCTAAQLTLNIIDRHGASAFLDENKFDPGDILSDVGFMGGYSLFRVQIDKELRHISLLCGIRAVPEFEGAYSVVSRFLDEHPWIGGSFIKGRGAIPINGPYHKLGARGLALLGDAAGQVYAAHGSGIGFGLISAKLLADAIIFAEEHGLDLASEDTIALYERDFHRYYYQRLFFAEHFRRFSQNLSPAQMTRLIASGVLSEELAKQTLLQAEPSMSLPTLARLVQSAIKSPRVFVSMMPVFQKAIKGKLEANRLGKQRN